MPDQYVCEFPGSVCIDRPQARIRTTVNADPSHD
jgi:hypothetical protein